MNISAKDLKELTDGIMRLMYHSFPMGVGLLRNQILTEYNNLLADSQGQIPQSVDNETLDAVIRDAIGNLAANDPKCFDDNIDSGPHTIISNELYKMSSTLKTGHAQRVLPQEKPVTVDNHLRDLHRHVDYVMDLLQTYHPNHLFGLHHTISQELNVLPAVHEHSNRIIRIAMARSILVDQRKLVDMEAADIQRYITKCLVEMDEELSAGLKKDLVTDDKKTAWIKVQIQKMEELFLPELKTYIPPHHPSNNR